MRTIPILLFLALLPLLYADAYSASQVHRSIMWIVYFLVLIIAFAAVVRRLARPRTECDSVTVKRLRTTARDLLICGVIAILAVSYLLPGIRQNVREAQEAADDLRERVKQLRVQQEQLLHEQ